MNNLSHIGPSRRGLIEINRPRLRWSQPSAKQVSIADALMRTVELHGEAVHCICHLAPLREPAARKAEGEVGSANPALAQAHSGRRSVAHAARIQERHGG